MSEKNRNVNVLSITSPSDGFMEVFGDAKFDATGTNANNGGNLFMQQHGIEHTLKPSFLIASDSTDIDTRHFILASQGAIKVFGKYILPKLHYAYKKSFS